MPGIVNESRWYSGVSTPATSSALGLVRPDGITINVDAAGGISVPTETANALGLVKPDGTTTTVSNGAISVPTASTSSLGLVKVDGTSITITNGVISANSSTQALEARVAALEAAMERSLEIETNNVVPTANSGNDD